METDSYARQSAVAASKAAKEAEGIQKDESARVSRSVSDYSLNTKQTDRENADDD